jgi:D-galactarolactone cycloisomerase
MKISRITCTLLSYPLPAPLRPSWAPGRTFTSTSCTLVEVTTDEGITGVGAMPQTGQVGLHTIADMVTPYILGWEVHAVERISQILRHAARDGSYPWAVEMALWDILGKAAGMPVYQLWGGHQETLPVYASLAEIVSAEEQIERLHRLKERGFRAFKLRLRRPTVGEDIAMVTEVRKAFGNTIDLMVDANQAHVMPSPGPHNFSNYTDALKVARAMHELGVLWLEEPLPRYNYEQLAQLTAATDIPIAGGELNIGLNEYRDLILKNCYDIIQADAAFSEGIFQLRKVAGMAEMCYKRFIPHTWSNGVGLGANLHLAMSLPNCPWFEFPVDPPAWTDEARDFMLAEPYHVSADGSISVSKAPGLGIELNPDAIQHYTIAAWSSDESSST